MTETVTERRVSVKFERKITDGDYGGITASVWIEDSVPAGASDDDIAARVGQMFTTAKVSVWQELGIGIKFTDDGEMVEARPAPQPTKEYAPKGGGAPSGGVRVMNKEQSEANGPLPDWLERECASKGIKAVWDNRHSATGDQPWFKESVPKGQKGRGIWPPRGQ